MKKTLLILVVALCATTAMAQEKMNLNNIVGVVSYSAGTGIGEDVATNNCAVDLGYRISNSFTLTARYEDSLILFPEVNGIKSYERGSTLGLAAWFGLYSWDWVGLELVGAGGTSIDKSPWDTTYGSATINLVGRDQGKAKGLSVGLGVRHNVMNNNSFKDFTSFGVVLGVRW